MTCDLETDLWLFFQYSLRDPVIVIPRDKHEGPSRPLDQQKNRRLI